MLFVNCEERGIFGVWGCFCLIFYCNLKNLWCFDGIFGLGF